MQAELVYESPHGVGSVAYIWIWRIGKASQWFGFGETVANSDVRRK